MFLNILFGIFLILHGLVHLIYLLHSQRVFQLPELDWPDDSLIFKQVLGISARRMLAVILLGVSLFGFVIGGIGTLAHGAWAVVFLQASVVVSSAVFLMFWNGKFKKLDQQGIFAIMINLGVLLAISL